MPMIKNRKKEDICTIKAKISPELLEQIESYCQWAGIYDLGYFIEKASNVLFLKDSEWQNENIEID